MTVTRVTTNAGIYVNLGQLVAFLGKENLQKMPAPLYAYKDGNLRVRIRHDKYPELLEYLGEVQLQIVYKESFGASYGFMRLTESVLTILGVKEGYDVYTEVESFEGNRKPALVVIPRY